jgi:hypothetical protein
MATFNLTSATNLFKIKYGKLSEQTYNSANVLLGRAKKEYNFTGKRMDVAVPTSFSGGVGSGALPTANSAAYEDAQITAKKVYSVIEVEREAIQASENDEGAFVRMTKETVKKGVESFNRNMSRILFNDGTGKLGVSTAAAAGGTAAAPTIVISTATWKLANFEEKDYINIDSAANAYAVGNVWEITAVAPSTRTITLARISGSVDLTGDTGAKTVYMQNSKDLDPQGLKGALDATSGSLYGITVARRWQAFQKAAGGAGLTTDLMNECMLGVEQQSGKVPNLIVTSYVQYRKLLNQLEDQKQYLVEPRMPELKGKVSFRGVEFMSNAGPVGVFVDRFVEDDRMYFLNDNYITLYHRPGSPGWADDDGTVFLRKSSSDDYQARYVSYLEAYIPPSFHGVLSGLA